MKINQTISQHQRNLLKWTSQDFQRKGTLGQKSNLLIIFGMRSACAEACAKLVSQQVEVGMRPGRLYWVYMKTREACAQPGPSWHEAASVARFTCFHTKSLQASHDSRASIQNHYKRRAIHVLLCKITTSVARFMCFCIKSLQASRDWRVSIWNHYKRRATHVCLYKKITTSVTRFTRFYIKSLQPSRD